MGISTPAQAIPSRPAAVSKTSLVYFDDFIYNATAPLPVDFNGAANLTQSSIDANHPGVWSSDLSVSPPTLRWMPPSPGINFFRLQQYDTLNLEWLWMLTANPAGTRFQQSMGWSDSTGCVQNSDSASVVWSNAGCANTPGHFFYLSTDNGGAAQYIATTTTFDSILGVFTKFNLTWNKAQNRISFLINGVQAATTTSNIPSGATTLPFFSVQGFAIGPNVGFWRIDYVKMTATLTR